MDSHILVKDGWTKYDPPDHEGQAKILSGILDGFTEDCRRFARVARTAQLDNLHHKFNLTWDEFCTTRLYASSDVVEAIIIGVEVIGEEMPVPVEVAQRAGQKAMELRATAGNPTGHNQYTPKEEFLYNKNSSKTEGGTSQAYLNARLRRDAPAMADALERGEYNSVRAACIAAGIIQPVPLLAMSKSRHKTAKTIVEKMGAGYAKGLAIEILELVAPAIEDQGQEALLDVDALATTEPQPHTPVFPETAAPSVLQIQDSMPQLSNGLPDDLAHCYLQEKLCPHGHIYEETGRSLRYRKNKKCVACERLKNNHSRQNKEKTNSLMSLTEMPLISSEES